MTGRCNLKFVLHAASFSVCCLCFSDSLCNTNRSTLAVKLPRDILRFVNWRVLPYRSAQFGFSLRAYLFGT